MTANDLLIAIGIGAGLLVLAQSSQVNSTQADQPLSSSTTPPKPPQQAPISLSYGGGGGDSYGSGSYLYDYGGGYNPVQAANNFANWVGSIQVGGYPQQTGVIYVGNQH